MRENIKDISKILGIIYGISFFIYIFILQNFIQALYVSAGITFLSLIFLGFLGLLGLLGEKFNKTGLGKNLTKWNATRVEKENQQFIGKAALNYLFPEFKELERREIRKKIYWFLGVSLLCLLIIIFFFK